MPNTTPSAALKHLTDSSLGEDHRIKMMIDALVAARDGDEAGLSYARALFKQLENGVLSEEQAAYTKALKQVLAQLEAAPLRPATFIRLEDADASGSPHALLSLTNGDSAYVALPPDRELAKKLKLGDEVLIDSQGKILLRETQSDLYPGHEARLERKVDKHHIEVMTHQDDRLVVIAPNRIIRDIDQGKLLSGSSIILGAGNRVAVRAVPKPEKETDTFRFLDRGKVPDVVVERDIGSPPRVIAQVERHIREEMLRPDLRRRFKLRPCITRLLCGVSGTGKTLAVQAIHRRMYDVMSEITQTPVDDLPPRVFKFKNSQMLSMWLGESDKNADRLFDEVEKMAVRSFTAKNGVEFRLPVLVVMEEADGFGRARGEEAIYDRILTTILQRLDPNRRGLSDQLVVFLSTTNEPKIVDPAFLRRIGGEIETFGRLNAESFADVLRKHVAGLPAATKNGDSEKKAWDKIVRSITDWLFDEESASGVVELHYHPHAAETKYHRDFLTGALVDRSVQQAATAAWEVCITQNPKAGIKRQDIMCAINRQVLGIAQQLSPANAAHYLDVPEGASVVKVKRLI